MVQKIKLSSHQGSAGKKHGQVDPLRNLAKDIVNTKRNPRIPKKRPDESLLI